MRTGYVSIFVPYLITIISLISNVESVEIFVTSELKILRHFTKAIPLLQSAISLYNCTQHACKNKTIYSIYYIRVTKQRI